MASTAKTLLVAGLLALAGGVEAHGGSTGAHQLRISRRQLQQGPPVGGQPGLAPEAAQRAPLGVRLSSAGLKALENANSMSGGVANMAANTDTSVQGPPTGSNQVTLAESQATAAAQAAKTAQNDASQKVALAHNAAVQAQQAELEAQIAIAQAQAANAAAQTAQAWANVEEQNAALAQAAPGPQYVQAVANAQAAENQLIAAERQQSVAEAHVQSVEAPPSAYPPPWAAPPLFAPEAAPVGAGPETAPAAVSAMPMAAMPMAGPMAAPVVGSA